MATSTEGYSAESIPVLRSYVENQGDKFHPLSDELRVVLGAPVASQELLLAGLLEALAAYEAAPASPYHGYHIEQLRERLLSDEAED